MKYEIGQKIVYFGVICTVCKPENNLCPGAVWIDNPEKGYKHWVNPDNLKPLTGEHL